MGATKTINPINTNVSEEVMKITGGKGVDVAVDITGTMKGFDTACQIITGKGRGKILIPSFYAKPELMNSGAMLGRKAPILHSVHPQYSLDYMDDIVRGVMAYSRGILPLNKLITHEFKLEEINEAFKMLEKPTDGYIKGVIRP